MTIIVTGGAGFIGSNFVFHMLKKYPDYRIICLDKLTYAGNLSTLAPVMENPNFRFVKADICDREAVFKLFMRNTRRWNRFVQYLQATTSIEGKPLSITAPIRKQKRGSMLVCDEGLMHELEKIGMIEDLRFKGDRVSYRFRSMTVRQCLNDIGVWLELYVYKTARDCGGFDDARISVVVDWNAVEDEAYNTINELDVVLTYGVRPVFISCKSGIPNTTALNEIKMLTNLFGGSHAKGVLATMCDLKKEAPAAYQRALDMGIGVIDKDDFTSGMLAERLLAVAKQ